jgi:hypothetical protein
MSDRGGRIPRRRPGTRAALLVPTPTRAGERKPPYWRSMIELIRLDPRMAIGLVVEAVMNALSYVSRNIIMWDEVRRRHVVAWRHPAAFVVVPLTLLAFVLAMIFVAPIMYAYDARRRYKRWQEVNCGRK